MDFELGLKLVLTPVLIGLASLAGRRWGESVGGWLVGIPFTSGPIVLFLALAHGTSFAAAASLGVVVGTVSQTAFVLAYALVARQAGWAYAVLAGTAGFALVTVAARAALPPLWVALPVAIASLLVGIALLPRAAAAGVRVKAPAWDLPIRMLVATVLVVALTSVAPRLGAQLTGLLAPYPLYAAVLAVFAHAQAGAVAGVQVLRGLLYGLFSFAFFFTALALALVPLGLAPAFAIALALGVVAQTLSLRALNGPLLPARR